VPTKSSLLCGNIWALVFLSKLQTRDTRSVLNKPCFKKITAL